MRDSSMLDWPTSHRAPSMQRPNTCAPSRADGCATMRGGGLTYLFTFKTFVLLFLLQILLPLGLQLFFRRSIGDLNFSHLALGNSLCSNNAGDDGIQRLAIRFKKYFGKFISIYLMFLLPPPFGKLFPLNIQINISKHLLGSGGLRALW